MSNTTAPGKWHSIADGYSCRFVIKEDFDGVKLLNCQWKPKVPSGKKLRQLTGSVAYLDALTTFISEMKRARGAKP